MSNQSQHADPASLYAALTPNHLFFPNLYSLEGLDMHGVLGCTRVFGSAMGVDCAHYRGRDLLRAVQAGDVAQVDRLLTAGGDVCTTDTGGCCLLSLAVIQGHMDLVWLLVKHGADLEQADKNWRRPLHEACSHGRIECTQYLLHKGAKVDSLKQADWTPLMLACTHDNVKVISVLVEAGADLRLKNKDGWTPFHLACREGHLPVVQHLLSLPNAATFCVSVSNNGRTPLHTAAQHGHVEVVRCMLDTLPEMKEHLETADTCGTTPLISAVLSGSLETLSLLVDRYGVSVGSVDKTGKQAIHWAAQTGYAEILRYLVDRGALLDARDSIGFIPLHHAAREGKEETVSLIIGLNPSTLEATDNKGRTALQVAQEYNRQSVVARLGKLPSRPASG